MVRSLDDARLGLAEAPPDEVTWADVDAEDEALRADRQRRLRRVVDLVIVGLCVAFVLWHLQPDLLLRNTTPAGGDMGAHVWGPAYLRDHLLPHGQVSGWAPDWYAGFPAYQFYMVLPSLLIVLVNAGIHGPLSAIPALLAVALAGFAWSRRHDRAVCIAAGV